MKIGLYGGSFDPVHSEHVRLVRAAISALGLDRVEVLPSFLAPHKKDGANASSEDRLGLCRLAFGGMREVHVNDMEIRAGGTSYTYLTCRKFRALYPEAELYFLVGADMLENFFTWKNPDDILSNVTLAACGRGELLPEALSKRFLARFKKPFVTVPFTGKNISSTDLRVALAFRFSTDADLSALDPAVLDEITGKGLYQIPAGTEALGLETPKRRAHSYRVALLACRRAHGIPEISEHDALLSSMLHDCAKYVSMDSEMLSSFEPPEGVPAPVLHQYAGAYLAEHCFGVKDETVLDAIRFHASGKPDMTALGKLVYLSDLLESERGFEGVEELRTLFWKDLDACMKASLFRQLRYLESTGKPVYPLTRAALEWYQGR